MKTQITIKKIIYILSIIFYYTIANANNYTNLHELFISAEFDPADTNSTIIVQISDLHIDPVSNYFPTPVLDSRLVNEINGLEYMPDAMVVSGDIAISRSAAAGLPRYPSSIPKSTAEISKAMDELTRFDSRIKQWIIAGNHDTDAHEIDPELWTEITGFPAYQRIELSNVPVFLLNGKHSGDFDEEQQIWIKEEFKTINDSQDVIIFVHQPSLGRIGAESGVKKYLVNLLAGRRGKVWVFSGHDHRFDSKIYVEKSTQFIQTIVTTGNTHVFNDGRNPGYGLICLNNGKVICRVFKDVKVPYFQLLPKVEESDGVPFDWPYANVDYPIMNLTEGTYDREEYSFKIHSTASSQITDTGTWLSYMKDIQWELPLNTYSNKATEVLILGSGTIQCSFALVSNTNEWYDAGIFTSLKEVFRIQIPTNCIGKQSLIKVYKTNESYSFAGWGMGSDSEKLLPIEKWMSKHFKQIRNIRASATDATPADDGISNLMKYALGTNPLERGRYQFHTSNSTNYGGLPYAWTGQHNSLACFGIRFPRRKAETSPGVEYIVEESNNLVDWKSSNVSNALITEIDSEWDDVIICQPSQNSSNHFFKLDIRLTSELIP